MACSFCGREDCDGVQFMQPDPYQVEVEGNDTPYLMCAGMAYDSAQDI